MNGRVLLDDEVRQAHEEYMANDDASIRSIADVFPVSQQTLASAFHRLGLPTKTRGRAPRGLSSTDRRVHAYLITYMTENDGVPPSVREIATELGYSTPSVVSASLIYLRNRGLIRLVDGSRNIRLIGGRYIYSGEEL